MSQAHDEMVLALKQVAVTRLREVGFKGSFPHFRRPGKTKIDLLTFQFDKWGGGFVIEISKCPPEGIITPWGEHIPAEEVRAGYMHPDERLRLQPGRGSSRHDWFRYDESAKDAGVFQKTAMQVLPFLEQAEKWWGDTPDDRA